ncbi:hypothetical protein EVAR_6180_1 [Eumeta japonica]|uniref:Uncharacterized protein n=1 Tax=Eumeta variegata TaxID=151549 RepID=A0A4C1THV5_EUMVA|nr:hypothetical protein EVAR_6180_1 [Eumeta japonica]
MWSSRVVTKFAAAPKWTSPTDEVRSLTEHRHEIAASAVVSSSEYYRILIINNYLRNPKEMKCVRPLNAPADGRPVARPPSTPALDYLSRAPAGRQPTQLFNGVDIHSYQFPQFCEKKNVASRDVRQM